MKRKGVFALLTAAAMAFSVASVSALENNAQERVASITERFTLHGEAGEEFSMISEDGETIIHINNDTVVYFEDYVPMDDDFEEMTRNAREVLFGRTLAEVLENRNLRVVLGENDVAEFIEILFETAVTLPINIGDDLDIDLEMGVLSPFINGEIVVNGEILETELTPFFNEEGILMIPLRVVAEALGYDVNWDGEMQSIRLGVAIHTWIGNTEAHRGRMAPIELSTAPILVDSATFVSMDFVQYVLAQTVYVFEGQVVIETYSDMM